MAAPETLTLDTPPKDLPPKAAADKTCTEPGCSNPPTPRTSSKGATPTKCEQHKRAKGSQKSETGYRTPSNVEAAVNALDTLYGSLVPLLMFVSPHAASDLEGKRAGLREQNRTFLTNDPELAKSIVKQASKTGRAGFYTVNGLALLAVGNIALADIQVRRKEAQARADANKPATETKDDQLSDLVDRVYSNGTPRTDPEAAFSVPKLQHPAAGDPSAVPRIN